MLSVSGFFPVFFHPRANINRTAMRIRYIIQWSRIWIDPMCVCVPTAPIYNKRMNVCGMSLTSKVLSLSSALCTLVPWYRVLFQQGFKTQIELLSRQAIFHQIGGKTLNSSRWWFATKRAILLSHTKNFFYPTKSFFIIPKSSLCERVAQNLPHFLNFLESVQ